MEYIKINESVTFSRIIQGLWRLDSFGMSDVELVDFIEGCVNRGVTTFDIAEIYGNYTCEEILGRALKLKPSLRNKIQIVTKTGINIANTTYAKRISHYDTRYDKIIESCKNSIEKMNCGYIDCYLIHREDPCIDHQEVARALNELKEQGLILSYGVSNFDPYKFDALYHFTNGQLVTNQIEVNPLVYEHFDSGMIDLLSKYQIPPMIWSPLAGGQIFTSDESRYVKVREKLTEIGLRHNVSAETIAFAWLLYHPVKMMPISGSKNFERLDKAIQAFTVKLTHEEWYEIYISGGKNLR